MLLVMHNVITENAPSAITSLFKLEECTGRPSRIPRHFYEPFTTKMYCTSAITWIGPRLWNTIIAPRFPQLNSVPSSKRQIKELIKIHMTNDYQ